MSTNPHAPHFVLAAVTRIYADLPLLVGADWPTIQPQVDAHIATLQSQPEAHLASTQLFGLLARYEPARQRLAAEIKIQETITYNLTQPLTDLNLALDDHLLAAMYTALRWEIDPATVPAPNEDVRTRAITMKDGGVAGGRSIKFRNLDLNLVKMMLNVGNLGLAVHSATEKPMPFVVAASILVMVGTLLNEMSVKIEQQEATVFWGMIRAAGTMTGAGLHEETIREATNAEREKYGLDALTEAQVRASLSKLVGLKSVEQSGSTYRIIERYSVKS